MWDLGARLWVPKSPGFKRKGGALEQGLLGAAVSSSDIPLVVPGSFFSLKNWLTRRMWAGPEVYMDMASSKT